MKRKFPYEDSIMFIKMPGGIERVSLDSCCCGFVKSALVVDMFKFMFKFIMDGEDYG